MTAETTARVATVVVSGRPHVLTPAVVPGSALLWAGFPGPHGGAAIAEALVGRRSPTGRLPFTAPRSSGVVPVHHNDRHVAAGVYRDEPEPVLHPFGAGVGYRDAVAESLRVVALKDGAVEASVHVQNPHAVAVTAVLPLFLRRWGGRVLPRRQELGGVLRARLSPGEHRDLVLVLEASAVRAEGAARPWLRVEVAGLAQELRLPDHEEAPPVSR